MDDAVDHGGGDGLVAEDASPAGGPERGRQVSFAGAGWAEQDDVAGFGEPFTPAELQRDGPVDVTVSADSSPDGCFSHLFTALTNGVTYYVGVRAVSLAGSSEVGRSGPVIPSTPGSASIRDRLCSIRSIGRALMVWTSLAFAFSNSRHSRV